ncbi:hypothetical protein [Halomonas sp. AOP42-D1-22]|uniref:hypothetical protein n=1 Tax=Halomonas sp. AOP42-D1-22 TaxID=3457667 RepID=UPI0040347A00
MNRIAMFLQYRRSLDLILVAISFIGVLLTSGDERVLWSMATLISIAVYYIDLHRAFFCTLRKKMLRR